MYLINVHIKTSKNNNTRFENEKSQNTLRTPQCLVQVLLVIRFGSSPEISGFLHLAVESASILLVLLSIADAVLMPAVAVRHHGCAVGHTGVSVSLTAVGLAGVLW